MHRESQDFSVTCCMLVFCQLFTFLQLLFYNCLLDKSFSLNRSSQSFSLLHVQKRARVSLDGCVHVFLFLTGLGKGVSCHDKALPVALVHQRIYQLA